MMVGGITVNLRMEVAVHFSDSSFLTERCGEFPKSYTTHWMA